MRSTSVIFSVVLGGLLVALSAAADVKAPIAGKAPPAEVEKPKQKQAAKTEPAPEGEIRPFDISGLGPIDPATDKAIGALDTTCRSSEFRREGPSQAEVAKCNVAIAKVATSGKKGASAIFASLNTLRHQKMRSFSRSRTFSLLGKLEDETVRDVLVTGLAKIASEKASAYVGDARLIDQTLREMAGSGPLTAIPWEEKTVRDSWQSVAASAEAWRAFQKANAGKKRAEIVKEALALARADRKSDDAKKAYRAVEVLIQRAPKEALAAARQYQKRSDLPDAVRGAFASLESRCEWAAEAKSKA